MKILVTGRNGQVARSLSERCPDDVELICEGRPDLDIADAASVDSAVVRQAPDLVINAAAYTLVDRAESDESAAWALNVNGAAHVARACAFRDIPLIHLSTDYVFDGGKPTPYRENDPAQPINVYGRTKLAGEQAVARHCTRHLIVRTAWVYSPWGGNFVLTMLRLGATRPSLGVVDDQHGNPTYAPHLADALLAMARRAVNAPASVAWGIYHAAGQGETTWCGFAREIFQHAGELGLPSTSVSAIATAGYPTVARRPMNSRLDCRALQSSFAVALPSWQTGLGECLARVATERALPHV